MPPELSRLDTWLADQEAAVGGIRPNCQKQIVWANGPVQTKLSIVYIHGFSASPGEVRPVPDRIAQAFGANLFFTRLMGHGQDGKAMGKARLSDWEDDVKEALAIGAALGEETLLMGCSTGCTLLTTALARGGKAKGIVHLSPNYGLRHALAHGLLQMPGVRVWGPWIVGRERRFEPISEQHSALWTTRYDTQAVFTMADAVRAAQASAIETITTPAYFAFSESDDVVHPAKTKRVMRRWGGPVVQDLLIPGPGDDKDAHVMAGDVFSPSQTEPLVSRICDWVSGL